MSEGVKIKEDGIVKTKVEEIIDLFEQLKKMHISKLGEYTSSFNIFLNNNKKEGIYINFMDLEHSKNNIKVIVDGEVEYWSESESKIVRFENRNWENT